MDQRDFLEGRDRLIDYITEEALLNIEVSEKIVNFLIKNNYISDVIYTEACADRGTDF